MKMLSHSALFSDQQKNAVHDLWESLPPQTCERIQELLREELEANILQKRRMIRVERIKAEKEVKFLYGYMEAAVQRAEDQNMKSIEEEINEIAGEEEVTTQNTLPKKS